jgi:hypothetical protein
MSTGMSEVETIPVVWAAYDLSQAVGHPVTDRTLGNAAARMGVAVRDSTGRVAIPVAAYQAMKASYVTSGYYSARKRGAPFKVKEAVQAE